MHVLQINHDQSESYKLTLPPDTSTRTAKLVKWVVEH